ncbi:phage holin family protein [Nesterenkonia aerolata]|uniref:Phage holin family protein n=1 Tax=Nesterenkonia aerolata TaxID=3074079 RepID=A0ABU2DPH3_9MICC|nr:phage holin family protein [Nesterenkonia sp. LY-0111]MDR8018408.1 phage holin family protein [Nesterenkonia sp. LY-0111]
MRILLATVLNALALGAAAWLIPGIGMTGADTSGGVVLAYLFVGAVFGVVNAVIKPLLSFVAMPITCLTLGLFAVVINAAMLMLTAWLTDLFSGLFGVEFFVHSFFWDAVLGALIVALVSAVLGRFLVTASAAPRTR